MLAVLDWELSTLGDPFADVAYNCLAHYLPSSFPMLRGRSQFLTSTGARGASSTQAQGHALADVTGLGLESEVQVVQVILSLECGGKNRMYLPLFILHSFCSFCTAGAS